MRKINFLSKSSSRDCGHDSVTLASTVGSQEEFYVSGGNSRGAFTPADVCQTSSVRLNRFTAYRRGAMLKLLSVLVLILTIGVGNVWGAEDDTAYTLTCTQNSSNTAYANTFDVVINYKTWNAPGNQNAGSGWRVGGAKGTNVSRYITGKSTIDKPIKKITVNHNGRSNSNITINSFSVTVSKNSDFSSPIETKTVTSPSVSSAGSFDLTPTSSPWPSGCYYKFTLVYTHSKSSNYGLDLTSLVFVEGASGSVPVTGVNVSPTTKSIVPGETFAITPTVSPAGATNKAVSWTSSATSKATVSNGTVTGVAAGSSTITCTTTDGGFTATCDVTVCGVTMQALDEEGHAIPTGGPGAPTRSGKSITPAADANNYVFKEWSISGASLGSDKTIKSNTITNPTGAVTVTAVYYKPITITYKANGSTFTTQTYGHGGTLAFPASDPDGKDYSCTGKTFVGWVGEANKDYSDASTPPTYATAGGSVTAAATYYAVFADAASGGSTTKTDELTYSALGFSCVSQTNDVEYTDFSDVGGSVSDAVYAGQIARFKNTACNTYIQMRSKNNNSGIITTTSGGKAKKVTVTWNSTTPNDKVLNIYGKSTAYSAASDLYADATDGDLLGTITKGTSTYYTITGDYEYIGLRSSDGSVYFDDISIDWQAGGGVTYSNYATSCCSPLVAINNSFTATSYTASARAFSWANESTAADVDHYELSYKQKNLAGDPANIANNIAKNVSSYTHTADLTQGTTYTYYLKAVGASGHCDATEEVDVTIPYATSTVTFDANGATGGSVPADITQTTGTTVTVPGNTGSLAKDNYDFGGWNTKDDGTGTNYAANATFTLSGNITLYAKWNCAKKVNVAAGTPSNGSFSLSATGDKYTCDDAVVINVTDITPASGYRFKEITQTGVDANDVTINQASKTVTYAQYANGASTINVVFELIPEYTITWSVNGATSTSKVVDGNALVLPTPAPTTDGCEDGKTFVGWTATAIDGSTNTKPGDLFTTTTGVKPTISSDKTFYAVFATSSVTPGSTETILEETFEDFSSGSPTAPGTNATKVSGSSMTYTCTAGSGSGTTATNINTTGGPEGDNSNILIRNNNGSFAISNIPTNGASSATLTYKWRGKGTLAVTGSSNISLGSISTDEDDKQNRTCSCTITINSGTTYSLTFTNTTTTTDNLRFDHPKIVATTAEVVSETGYITSCTKQVKVESTAGGSATINEGAAVAWVDDETEMNLVATPAEGYVFAGWTSTGATAEFGDEYAATTTVITAGTATITANFVAGSTISADKNSLDLEAYVNEGGSTTVTFTSSDAPQYGTVQYTIEDDTYISVSPASTYLSTSNLNATVTVSYGDDEAGSYNTNLVATAYNTNSVAVGTKIIPITLTIKPKFTVTAVADDASHATAVSASPNANVKDGTTVTLSQTAADDWVFQKWTISYTLNAVAYNEDLDGNTFTMPAANVTATAVYTEKSGTDLTAPTNATAGSITSHSAALSWDAVDHASSYSIYIYGSDESENTIDGITTNSYTITGLKAEIDYVWTVTAIGDGEDYYNSPASETAEFTTTARILSSIAIKKNASKMTYNEGETFDKTGLEVTATYDDETTATISAASLVVPTTPLTAGTTSITVSYTENAVEKTTTLNGITVNALFAATWTVNGTPYGEPTYTLGAIGTLPANPSSACSTKYPYFVKWVIGDDPTADAVTSETVIDGNVTINAVFAKTKTKTGYSSTAATEIVAGGEYVMGAAKLATDATMYYFSSYSGTDSNISWGEMSTDVDDAIVLTASGTTSTFQLKDASNNYVAPLTTNKFQMSSTMKSLSMTAAGAIKADYYLRHNYSSGSGGLRWYNGTSTGTAVYLYAAEYSYSNLTILCPATYTAAAANVISNGSVGLKLQAEDDAETSISDLEANATVLLVATPDEGYEFKSWTVMQGESDITESNVEGNVLTMPAGNVTVSASFNKIAVTGVTINGEANVQINNDVVWTLDITPAEARPTIVWSTANDAVATVNNGTVHGVAVGETTITATVDGTPYNKTINVIAATVLNSISISTPQTEFTMGDAFVAPTTVTAHYVYEVGGGEAPSVDVTASATISGYNMNAAGQQTVTVSYETKSYQYNINVAPWTLHLQTKRLYGNDVETPTVVDATITTLEAPTALNGYYVTGLCDGYTQLGYITSSEDIDALPAEVLTSYTPSANNETLYGVFKKTNYAGVDVLTEDFSVQEAFNANFPTTTGYTSYSEGSLRIGSGSNGGSITSKALDLSHNFKVEVSAKRYTNDNNVTLYVKVGSSDPEQQTLTSSYDTYTFDFDATESTTVQIYTSGADKRLDINSIHIYTLDDIEYTSVYDCREEKDVEYVINNDKVVWTACENTTVMEGQEYTLCANEPSLQGYDFGGWIINGDEENVNAAGTSIDVATDLTITPKFTEHVYDYSYALAATATNGTIASVTVNGIAKDLAEVELHDGDAVVVTATPNTNYELSEWTHSENIASLTTDGNTASFTVAVGAGDMTIAAVFVEKAQYTMTLNVFGRTYTTKQGHEGDTYSSVLDGAASPAISGYSFQGWSTDAENANAIISGEELLTADVTLYAIVGSVQPTGYVYHKVTSLGDITADGYYLIVNEQYGKAFNSAPSGKNNLDKNNNYVDVTVSENQIISNADIDAAVVTIDLVPETEHYYIKTASGYYLGAPATSNGFNASTSDKYENALDFIGNNFVVDGLVQQNETEMVMRFNNSNNRFGFYKGTQNPIQLYKRGDVHEEIIPEAEPEIEISTVVSASTSFPGGYVGDVTVVNGGSLDADINLSVGDLIIHSTLGKGTGTGSGSGNTNAPGNSGQIVNGNNITVTGDVYLELELTQDDKASAGWYAFSVPFPVDAMNGVYYGDTKLTNEVGYAIMSHYGDLRAKNEYAWKKFRGIMEPGVFYVITVGHTNYKTLRFKKVADEALVANTSVTVSPFPTQTGNNADGAWNGIGNPNLAISNLSTPVTVMQFYDHNSNTFIGRDHSVNLVVGSAFFIQYNATSSVSIPTTINNGHGYLAPQRERNADEDAIYEVSLTNMTTGEMEDNLFLTAREDATNEYEIGRDVAKMSMGTAKCAQMWVPAYGTKLCAADFPLVNSKATYPLMINTVQAGTYTIEQVRPQENAELYLTKNGHIIWNLTMSPCELELTQGQNEGYGLILRANAPSTATGVDEVQSDNVQCTKVVIDDHVYILRGGKMYGVDGKEVR